MEDDRRSQLQDLLKALLELPPPQRPEFLEQACGDDAGLRREIESLLQQQDQPSPREAPPKEPSSADVTRLLDAVSAEEGGAEDRLLSLIYDQLRAMARRQLAGDPLRRQHGTSSLVHEAYLRLLGKRDNEWPNRRYFFAAAGKAMWRIRCEWARLRKGPRQKEPLHSGAAAVEYDLAELLAIGEALEKLERIEARKADVVRLRYYCGLSVDETAEALGVSPRTVDSDWHFARSWLHRELKHGDTAPGAGGKARDDGQGPMGQNPRSLQAGAEPDA